MPIIFAAYSVTHSEAQSIYNASNSIIEINIQLLRKLNLDADTWVLALEIFNDICNSFIKFLLVNYRRIIAAVPPVTMWPGDTHEAVVFAKYWDMRNTLPCINEAGTVIQGRPINKQDVIDAINAIITANKNCTKKL